MKNDIIAALANGADTAAAANKKFGDAILKNICDNVQITYAWAAANPASGAPDPVVTFTATVSGGGTLTPSGSLPETLVKPAALIKGLVISAPAGFAAAPLSFNPAAALSVTMAGEDSQDAAMTAFCTQVVASLKSSFVNPAPAAGTHGVFTGATAGMIVL